MPNLFNILAPMTAAFKGAWKNPSAAIEALPPSKLKNDLKAKYIETKMLFTKMDDNTGKERQVDLGDNYTHYYNLQKMIQEALRENKIIAIPNPNADADGQMSSPLAYDTEVELNYIKFQNNPQDFNDWFRSGVELRMAQSLLKLDLWYASANALFETEHTVKSQIVRYQDNIVETLQEWSNYVDRQINEQTVLKEELDAVLSTQRRRGTFSLSDVESLEKWQSAMTNLFWIFVVILIVMILINYWQYIWNALKTLHQNTETQVQSLKDNVKTAAAKMSAPAEPDPAGTEEDGMESSER